MGGRKEHVTIRLERARDSRLGSLERERLDREAANEIRRLLGGINDLLRQKHEMAEMHASWAEQMADNEPDGYYGQACREVAAAIRAGAPVILPRPWLD
jgi:hypothetical protein